jgi:hypothetical protein
VKELGKKEKLFSYVGFQKKKKKKKKKKNFLLKFLGNRASKFGEKNINVEQQD